MKKIVLIVSCSFFALSTGCASIVSGHNQSVSVATSPVYGANCSLENNKGKWYVPKTPGSVVVQRSYNDLQITCEKPGYKTSSKKVKSSTKGMAFGNVLLGGAIGAGVDIASGAAYDYPVEILIPMTKS